ncbi:hypothetical protein E2C01_090867 [Portunus trituberculatus]|uniref:Uncharacterized protein n=1 Tax=Portunus trituberculatus TaxID=210409 RepID=A0A5B7JRI4_PORTR|nr:hypothetical protein [Portunus trituberculatus]
MSRMNMETRHSTEGVKSFFLKQFQPFLPSLSYKLVFEFSIIDI